MNVRLSGPGSEKRVHHHEIGFDGNPLPYLPGDAVGVHPANDPELVARLLAAIGATGAEAVVVDGRPLLLADALRHACGLDAPRRALVEPALTTPPPGELARRSPARALRGDAREQHRDVLDVIEAAGQIAITPQALVTALRRLQPRLYSVASSPLVAADRVHLLVGTVWSVIGGRLRLGVASSWLESRWPIGGTAACFLQDQQRHFAMPSDPESPMIMVGAGTGIAPFRGFLQHRRALGAGGRNWLFFGDQHRATDLVYADEWTAYVHDGLLRLDLAFSRDQPDKIYVHHRMRAEASELWAWLEDGATLFVCGSKTMAADVDLALHDIVAGAGGRTPQAAREYVAALAAAGRYKRDVY